MILAERGDRKVGVQTEGDKEQLESELIAILIALQDTFTAEDIAHLLMIATEEKLNEEHTEYHTTSPH